MWRLAARYSTVGIEMAVSVAFGTLGGLWLDGYFGTKPILFWIGLAAGVGAAVKVVVKIIRQTKLDSL